MKFLISIFSSIIIMINTTNFGFFYDSSQGQIYFDLEKYDFTNKSYLEDNLLNKDNLKKHYISLAGYNHFDIEYYSCNVSNKLNRSLDLIKVEYNLTEYDNAFVKEIILNMHSISGNIFPQKYKDEFIVKQNKVASNKGKKNRKTLIYDTLGFNVKSKSGLNFKISKILLVNFRNNNLNYLANLSYNIRKYADNNTFDIHLKNLPEDFDLLITLDLYNNNWKETGQKVLVVQKEFNYPNYRIEEPNPNRTMLIISISFIIIAFIITIILVLLKLIFGFFRDN